MKLKAYRMEGKVWSQNKVWLSDQMVSSNTRLFLSDCGQVISSITQEWVLGPLLFIDIDLLNVDLGREKGYVISSFEDLDLLGHILISWDYFKNGFLVVMMWIFSLILDLAISLVFLKYVF